MVADGRPAHPPGPSTLIDLMALVAGVAVALPFRGDLVGYLNSEGWGPPWHSMWLVGEVADLLGVALAPVIFAGRFRSGGAFRPAEWLLIVNASRFVHEWLETEGVMRWDPDWFGGHRWGPSWDRAWYAPGMVGFVLIVAALAATRGRVSTRWRLPLLVALPLFAFWGPAWMIRGELDSLWGIAWPDVAYGTPGREAYEGLMESPEQVLVGLPFAAAMAELGRGRGRAWGWGEWAGFGLGILAASMVIVLTIDYLVTIFPSPTGQRVNRAGIFDRLADLGIWAGWWAADLAIARAIVRSLGRRWDRWLAPGTPSG